MTGPKIGPEMLMGSWAHGELTRHAPDLVIPALVSMVSLLINREAGEDSIATVRREAARWIDRSIDIRPDHEPPD